MDDSFIIEMLFDRSEAALEQLAGKYGTTLYSISYNIVKNSQDAEECVNDTYLGIWNNIPPTRPNSLYAFICRMIRNISLTRYQYLKAEKRNSVNQVSLEEVADFLTEEDFCNREFESEEITKIIEEWLWSLNEQNRYIFIRRYWYMDEVPSIAQNLHLSNSAVYLRIDRMKKKLKEYLKQKGVLL